MKTNNINVVMKILKQFGLYSDSRPKMNTNRARGEKRKKIPAEVAVSEATTADDIFTKLSNEMLKAMFTNINSNGRNGAPPQSTK